MRRVLLTGAGGFVGSHALRHLLANTDDEVVCPVTFRHKGLGDRIRLAMDDRPDAARRVKIVRCDLATPISVVTDHEFGRIDYVLNFASESHVDRSIETPTPFILNNVALICNILDWVRFTASDVEAFVHVSTDEVYGPAPAGVAHKEWRDSHLPSNPYSASKAAQEDVAFSYWRTYDLPIIISNCWDTETEVLTEHGPRGYDDISVGDLVWTLDEDENMVLQPVLKKVRMPGPETMYHFTGHTEQLVTPNHRMMFRESVGAPRRWGGITEAHAEDLAAKVPSGRVQFIRNGYWSGDTRPTYRTVDLIRRRTGRGGNDLPDELTASWLARFFGWFVTEGTTAPGQVHMTGMKPGQQDIFRELLAEVGMVRIGTGPKSVYVSSKELATLAGTCGGKQDVRRIPAFVKAMDEEYLQEFLDAAIAGDGTRYGNSARIYTMNRDLAYDYAEVGMKCGHSAMVSRRVTKTFDGSGETETFYTSLAPRTGSNISANNIEKIHYDGDVWCVSVPSGRVFTTRRDGGIVLTGQTMNIIGETQGSEKFVPTVIKRVLSGDEMIIHASKQGKPGSRFYLHARNQADGVLHALRWVLDNQYDQGTGERLRFSDFGATHPYRFHIVGEREVDNLEMALRIADIVDKPLHYTLRDFHSSRPGHDLRYALDGSKMTRIGWKPPVPLDDSLTKTVEWTLNHPEWLKEYVAPAAVSGS